MTPTHRTVLVVGAAGGCGATTVALGMALAASRAGRRARLVELDPAGDLAGTLGVAPDRTLADLEPVLAELTAEQIRGVLHRHRTGVEILLGAGLPLDADCAARLVSAAATAADAVLDAAAGRCPRTRAAAHVAARSLIVSPPTIAGTRRAGRLAEWLGGPPPQVVIGVGAGRPELGRRAHERASGLEVVGELPHAPAEAEDVLAGAWPTGRRARLAGELDRLAARVLA